MRGIALGLRREAARVEGMRDATGEGGGSRCAGRGALAWVLHPTADSAKRSREAVREVLAEWGSVPNAASR
jgi:hypothetical protein